MSSAPTVRLATRDELPAVGRALARAFADDPVYLWLAPMSPTWEDRASRWFETEARLQFDGHGEVWVDDDVRGAAVWSPPGHWRSGIGDAVRIAWPSLRLMGPRLRRGLAAITAMERAHPRRPHHWYLGLLGTDPAHQGHGVGGALLRAVTDRCDEEGLPAYLESSKASNVAYYARFGFTDREPIRPLDGPPLIPMWRDPEAPR